MSRLWFDVFFLAGGIHRHSSEIKATKLHSNDASLISIAVDDLFEWIDPSEVFGIYIHYHGDLDFQPTHIPPEQKSKVHLSKKCHGMSRRLVP